MQSNTAKNQMRNSTRTNVEERIRWLAGVVAGKIKFPRQDASALANLRNFCKLSINNSFGVISYNTFKQAASALNPDDNLLIYDNGWATIRDLLEQARRVCAPAPTPSPKESLPPPKEILERTLLDAHICSMAYLELYNFLRQLSQDEVPASIKKSIENKLEITAAKFRLIISHSNQHTPPKNILRVVDSGKADEN